MYRRKFLAAMGTAGATGLGGCLDALSPDASGGVHAHVSIEEWVASPEDHPVAVDARVTEPEVTAEHPARVAITVTNEASDRELDVGSGRCALFTRGDARSEDARGLWLFRTGERVSQPEPDRWACDPPEYWSMFRCGLRPRDAGESVTVEYKVWDDGDLPGYFSPDTYRWIDRVEGNDSVPPGEEESEAGAEQAFAVECRLALQVEDG